MNQKRWIWLVTVVILGGFAMLVIFVPQANDLPFTDQLKLANGPNPDGESGYVQDSWLFGRHSGLVYYEGSATKSEIDAWVKTLKSKGWTGEPAGMRTNSTVVLRRGIDTISFGLDVKFNGKVVVNKPGNVFVFVTWWDSEGVWQKVKRRLHL